tara:strand:- start:6734 stop:7111 length:378 start_codon:yes stop_codon:yes gene_type:complete
VIKLKFWDSVNNGFCDDSDIFISSDGCVYRDLDDEMLLEPFIIPVQYTGVESRGVELYLGDVVQSSFGIPPIPVKTVIEFDDGAFIVKTPRLFPTWCVLSEFISCFSEVEVIGNIYENPDLVGDL